jgi:uncharacterized membrane protein
MAEKEEHEQKLLERITMFNDAVYAIALTLLVLELKLPEGNYDSFDSMWNGLKEMAPKIYAFILSVALVGGNWITSVNIQRIQIKATTGYIPIMIIYLALVSLTPFTCNLIGSYPDNPMSFLVFGIVMILLIINSLFYLRYCRMHNVYHEDADINEIAKLEKMIPIVGVLIMGITAIAFYNTKLSLILFLIYNFIPFFITKSLRINHKD